MKKALIFILACLTLICAGCRLTERADSDKVSTPINLGEMSLRNRWTSFDGEGGEERYRDAMSDIYALEDIESLFNGVGYPEKVSADDFKMLLEDRFFLIPVMKDSTLLSMTLYASGSTNFTLRLPDLCKLSITVCHGDTEFSYVSGTEFKTADGNPFIHEHNTNKADAFYMKTEGYWVSIYGFDVCECKQSYVETLTFKKVEIK